MFKNDDKVDDRSRNGSNAGNPPKREIVTLIKAVEKTAGESARKSNRKRDKVLTNSQFRKSRTLKLSPEWVLEKIPHTSYADGHGKVSVYTGNATDANFIELALNSLQVPFEAYDYLDDNKSFVFGFDFRLEDIRNECPTFYSEMKEINSNNLKNNKLWKN